MQPRELENNNERLSPSLLVENPRVRSASFARQLEPGSFEAAVGPALKEETGFHSYAAYREKNDFGYRECLEKPHRLRNDSRTREPQCTIIDLKMEKLLPTKVTLRCAASSATQTLTALREPPEDVDVQIVLLSIPDQYGLGLASGFASLLGLGLNLAPRFFDALQAQLERHANFEVSNNARFRCNYVLASGTVVAVAPHFALAKPESPPTVLIAGPPHIHEMVDLGALNDILYDGQPIQPLVDEDALSGRNDFDSEGARYYARLLAIFMKRNQDCTHDCKDLLLGSLLPLLQLDILRIRRFCCLVRDYFVKLKSPVYKNDGYQIEEDFAPNPCEEEAPDKLYRYRTILRSTIEQLQDEAESLEGFICSRIGERMNESSAYLRIQNDREWVLKEACRVEAEIRDYLQVQVGHLALLESRKSIELSNHQIQESKRGKPLVLQHLSLKAKSVQSKYVRSEKLDTDAADKGLVTILALIYVPLNLATSVFGMNLQQLNESGRNIGSFIATAVIALILTGISWWLMEQLNSFLAWRRRGSGDQRCRERPDYVITVRLAMLGWLVCSGHWSWMRKSGAGWHILNNSNSGFRNKHMYSVWVKASKGLTAGDFVSKFANEDVDRLTESFLISPFDPKGGQWSNEKASKSARTGSSV